MLRHEPILNRAVRVTVTTFVLMVVCWVGVLAQGPKKVATALLVDNTGSMRSQFSLVIELGRGIAAQAQPRGPVRLFTFMPQGSGSSSIAMILPKIEWTEDQHTLTRTIDDLYVVPGQTKLLDAITTVAADLNSRVALEPDAFSSKVIFLVTDGEDRSSKSSTKDLIKLLKDSGIQVNAVGLIEELDNDRFGSSSKLTKAKDLLERLTKETGGRVVFANPRADADEVLRKLLNK
jgi:von Willebrand factor type A domain